jgi:hypothetical protein
MKKFNNFLKKKNNLAKNNKEILHTNGNKFRNKRKEVYNVIKKLIKLN